MALLTWAAMCKLHYHYKPCACRRKIGCIASQLDLYETSQHVYCATACDDALGIRIFKPLKILYGAANRPPQSCKVETAVLTIMCELFAVPAVPHVDDNITVETVDAMATAGQAMVAVHVALGFKLSPAKAVPSRMRDDMGRNQIKWHVNWSKTWCYARRGVGLELELLPEILRAFSACPNASR